MTDKNLEYFTVRWRETVDGKMQKFDETFKTIDERDTFMAGLPSRPNFLEVTRYCDFEILYTFPE